MLGRRKAEAIDRRPGLRGNDGFLEVANLLLAVRESWSRQQEHYGAGSDAARNKAAGHLSCNGRCAKAVPRLARGKPIALQLVSFALFHVRTYMLCEN